jgi:hypothetical protein
VLYFAGENPDDLRMRWIALSEQMNFNRDTIDVHFVVGADKEISKIAHQIEMEVSALGGVCQGYLRAPHSPQFLSLEPQPSKAGEP